MKAALFPACSAKALAVAAALAVLTPAPSVLAQVSVPATPAADPASEPSVRQVTPFMAAVAEAAARDRGLAEFYMETGYAPIWTGQDTVHAQRRNALMNALAKSGDHALPIGSYDIEGLMAMLGAVETQRDLGAAEVALSQVFIRYANDVHAGVLEPQKIDSGIAREVPRRDSKELLQAFTETAPTRFLRSLPPTAPEYARLMRAKIQLEDQQARGGWGPKVPARALKPGQSGPAVVALRNRLIAMGYMERSAAATYDGALEDAVRLFQMDNGLEQDGVAGAATITAVNKTIAERLPNIIVAMERERWMNKDRGARHVWVNLTDFSSAIVDNDQVTFRTRSVVGKNVPDRRSVEFSDVMDHMVINPSWNVPRSIARKQYIPAILSNPGAAGHLQLVDWRGQVVSRGSVDFSRYSVRNFPFNLKQPPSRGNALGLVKFMFPNRHNIYLHDTPAKSLFARDRRDFSHGCIRLRDPFDFAYTLLERQEDDPKGFFHSVLDTGAETRVDLDQPIPVHLVYRTAYTTAKGRVQFRNDVYGRDGKIFDALQRAGVALSAVQS